MHNAPSSIHVSRWFDPRGRQAGSWAFILNRVSALGLTLYLLLHLAVLKKLVQGPETYDGFVESAQAPLIKVGEVILIAAVVFHGLNGLRLITHSLGICIPYQKQLFSIVVTVTILLSALFTLYLFGESLP